MKQDSFNQTAYRILKLLSWLMESSLTLEEVNTRFAADPYIGKRLSQDSIGLYLNTLKAIGCTIGRPTPSNGFHYQLEHHPLSYYLTPEHLSFLKQVVQNLDDELDYRDVLHFYKGLSFIFDHAANKNAEELKHHFFETARIADFDLFESHLHRLEDALQKQGSLLVTYYSPEHITRKIQLTPFYLFHQSGMFYVMGHTDTYQQPSMLRLDRIISLTALPDHETTDPPDRPQKPKSVFLVRIYSPLQGLCSFFQEHGEVMPAGTDPPSYLVLFQNNNEFMLRQHLLQSGVHFQILYPKPFRDNTIDMLETLEKVYSTV